MQYSFPSKQESFSYLISCTVVLRNRCTSTRSLNTQADPMMQRVFERPGGLPSVGLPAMFPLLSTLSRLQFASEPWPARPPFVLAAARRRRRFSSQRPPRGILPPSLAFPVHRLTSSSSSSCRFFMARERERGFHFSTA